MTSSTRKDKGLEFENRNPKGLIIAQFRQDLGDNYGSKDSTGIYLQEIGREKLLTPEEEVKYAKLVKLFAEIEETRLNLEKQLNRKPKETEICQELKISLRELRKREQEGRFGRKILIERNLRLVVSIAKKYLNRGLSFQDLIQEGSLGLIRGVEKFDVAKGYKLSTYAYWWIRQGITRGIAERGREIRLPIHISETLNRLKRAQKVLSQKLGRRPSKRELAEELGVTKEKVNELIEIARRPISLNTKVGESKEHELGDLIVDKKNNSPETELTNFETKEQVAALMAELTQQEQDVIKLRYGLEDGNCQTYAKIGSILNLSRQRVHQIEKDAMKKLRKASKSKTKKKPNNSN